uniref:uncharacterized protein LOC122588159 n=1 Tax=Erigeron canadensis TaxID=72917 RepID=UPI001CB9A9C9|nr:uncharacterized protein LOC122588159 [Erigeron canadensis]
MDNTSTTLSNPSSQKLHRKKTKKTTSIAIKVLKAPLRAICKIRDMYILGMYKCAAGMGEPTNVYTSSLPKSYSTTSSRADDDYAELIRIASTRSLTKLDPEFLQRQKTTVVARSQSLAFGRIDEDKTCDYFGDDFKLNNSDHHQMFPRSKSHAAPPLTRMSI